jgi:hypothetical protein
MDPPEPTEEEQEQAATKRHEDEEAMRGPAEQQDLPPDADDE